MGLDKLVSAAQTTSILLMVVTIVSIDFFTNVMDKVLLIIAYFLCICPIACSTWILTRAS